MDTVINIQNLSKKYTLRHQRVDQYPTLRDAVAGIFSRMNPLAVRGRQISSREEFWALKDVSLQIKEGEKLGIIGRNGAGKSTLLKILSRVIMPSLGTATIKGRVASLLEVGTGFHPELTGRENIYLNGAILGMSRREIHRKFDEIVAFAEIEKFLDTPIKRYSSGMYVRLAFAVAAHLEPEILIVDEVLAVGDAQFQKKCLGKMEDIGRDGRTVLFVSHNMTAVRNLCSKLLWLKDGAVHQVGETAQVSENYLRHDLRVDSFHRVQDIIGSLPSDPVFCLDHLAIMQKGILSSSVVNGEPIEIDIHYTVKQQTVGLRIYFDLCDEEQNILIRSFCDDDADSMSVVEPGKYCSRAIIPANLLAPRRYDLRIYGTIYNVRTIPPEGIVWSLQVENSNGINRAYPHEPFRAKLLPKIPWQTVQSDPWTGDTV